MSIVRVPSFFGLVAHEKGGAFWGLHILSAYWFPVPLWGADLLAYYPIWAQILYIFLGCALVWAPSPVLILGATRAISPRLFSPQF